MGRPIELTEAEFVSLPIPAHAELVIEGVLHAGDTEMEGPLGEFPAITATFADHSRSSK